MPKINFVSQGFARVESNTNLTVHRHLVDPGIHEEVHPVNRLDLEQYNTSFTVPDTSKPTRDIEQNYRPSIKQDKTTMIAIASSIISNSNRSR